MRYQVYAYDYPQCGAGLHSLVNCKIIQLTDEYQSRKDGSSGYDIMVPIEPNKIAVSYFTKDDVRKEKYLVIILNENIWELHWSIKERFNSDFIIWSIIKNSKTYDDDALPLPKEFKFLKRYVQSHDVDECQKIIDALNNITSTKKKCKFYSTELIKCGVNPSISCSICSDYEV
jgi:hypothetical protein